MSLDVLREKMKEDRMNKIVTTPLNIVNYIENVKLFYEIQPFFYDKSGLFWFWQKEKYRWEMVDDIDVMVAIDKNLNLMGQSVVSGTKNNYLEAFRRVGRENIPEEAPKSWIQFKDQVIDLKNNKKFVATPKYFFTNPIPWGIGNSVNTPMIDKLFKEWVGDDYVQTLYEILSYCCLSDYPIHLIICLVGAGRNGKSKFQTLISKFIGEDNVCSTELDTLLNSRFESFKLYKKLVCLLGETNFGTLSKTSLLKKLVGQDLIGFEYKHKKPFDSYNYATIIINSNSLPTSEDTSEGFYRRWLIIDFPNEFPEGKDILETIPEEEYHNLARKIALTLPKLLERGNFTNQGTIEERKQRYMLSSNPIELFITKCCDEKQEAYIRFNDLFYAYHKFLRKIKARVVTRKEFRTALSEQGYYDNRTTRENDSTQWIDGIELKPEFMQIMSIMQRSSLYFPYREKSLEVLHKTHKTHNLEAKEEISEEKVE